MNDYPDPEHNAEDAVQNTFITLITSPRSIDIKRGDKVLSSSVVSILFNECNKIIEGQKYFEELTEDYIDEEESDLLEDIISEVCYNEIIEAIEAMNERYSIPMFHYYVNQTSAKNIAKLLGISESAVYDRIHKGESILIRKLKGKNTNDKQ